MMVVVVEVPVIMVCLHVQMCRRRNCRLTSQTLKWRLMMVQVIGRRLRRRQKARSRLHHPVIVVRRLMKAVDLGQPLRSSVQMSG